MICEACRKNPATEHHHKLSQTKVYRKLYGGLLDHPRNIQMVCHDCHASHRSTNLVHYNELEFCVVMGIRPTSKTCGGVLYCQDLNLEYIAARRRNP